MQPKTRTQAEGVGLRKIAKWMALVILLFPASGTSADPNISVSPQNRTVIEGASVTFGVTANGTLPLSYQWLQNGTNAIGLNQAAMEFSHAQIQDEGVYSVIVSNAVGAITSNVATLSVKPASLFQWAVNGSQGGNFVMGMALDPEGNCFASGYGLNVSKFDPVGTLQWVRNVGTPACVAADKAGNVFVAGAFSSNTITLGSVTVTNTHLPSLETFLAKLDGNGDTLWAKATGPNPSIYNHVVTVTPAGEPVLARGSEVTKFDPFGNPLWTRQSLIASVTGISADSMGNILIGGYGSSNFVTKFSSNGDVVWAKAISGSGGRLFALAANSNGESFVTGQIDVTNMGWGTVVLTNGKAFDLFVAKLDAAGTVLWAKSAGGPSVDVPHGIGIDAEDNCYIAGGFSDAANFDWASVVSRGGRDVFVAKYSGSGDVQWVRQAGGAGTDNALALAVDPSVNSFLNGSTFWMASFGEITLTNSMRFIAKLVHSQPSISIQRDLGTMIRLSVLGRANRYFTVHRSTNFLNWVPWVTLPNPTGETDLIDPVTALPSIFYKVTAH